MKQTLLFFVTVAGLAIAQPRYFGNIQTYQVRPITGSTYSLGTTGARWTNFFTDRITLSTTGGFGFTTPIHPSADASFDIGSISSGNYRFKDLFLSGALNAYSLDLNSGTAITGALRPSVGSTYALGTTGSRWTNFFTDKITITATAGNGITSDLMPSADATMNFGGASYRWLTGNFSGTVTTGNVLSQAASTFSLGSTGNRWTNSFLDRITMSDSGGLGAASNFVPSATYTYNLGNTSYYWNGMWGRFVNLQSQSGGSPASVKIRDSSANLLFDMGDTGVGAGDFRVYDSGAAKFEVYSGNTNISTSAINLTGTTTLTGTLQAGANNLYNIGSSGNGFRAVYLNQLFVGGTRGLTTTVVVPCGTLTFTEGILTNKGAC
jgi:hypothetical protein